MGGGGVMLHPRSYDSMHCSLLRCEAVPLAASLLCGCGVEDGVMRRYYLAEGDLVSTVGRIKKLLRPH